MAPTCHGPEATAPPPEPRTPGRIPFPTVDEVSRHCVHDDEPETVHLEIHLPGRPDPDRLRAAFRAALCRHPRVLAREVPGRWWRRRYEWELTGEPDTDPVSFPPPTADALVRARERALGQCPPLNASPPVRMEVVTEPGRNGCVLVLTLNHTALDGPSCLRIVATAATLYGGAENDPPTPPPRTGTPPTTQATPAAAAATGTTGTTGTTRETTAADRRGAVRPARIAAGTHTPDALGNGLLLADLPVPPRLPSSPGALGPPPTVNDRLLVATCLMAARWNVAHDRPPGPVRITMPVDDRPRSTTDMPIGNGTRLVDVGFGPEERAMRDLLTAERPDPAAVARLLRSTAARTRALKAVPAPQLGLAGTLLTAPVLPVGVRAAVTRGLRRAAAPWTSTTLLSNIGRVPYPLDFGDAGRATAVWFSAPARMPRGLTVTSASTAGRLHLTLRWSRALLDDASGATLLRLFERALAATAPPSGEGTR